MLDALDTPLGQLTLVAVGYAALVAAGRARRHRWPGARDRRILDHAVWILELLMALRVVAGLGSMLGGQRPAELSAHVGYLVAAVCVLPIAMQSVGEDRGPVVLRRRSPSPPSR